MPITWDEPKRLANLAKHRLDFADFEELFSWDRFLTIPVRPSRTGRERFALVGAMADLVVVAIVSPLGREALSVVSLRLPAIRKGACCDEAPGAGI